MRGSKNKCIGCQEQLLLPSLPSGTAGAITPSAGCEAGTRSGQRDPGPGVLGSPAHPCPPCLAHEVLASLPLQMMLYFNVWYFPVWCLAEGTMLQLKVPSRGHVAPAQPPWARRGHAEPGRAEPLQR